MATKRKDGRLVQSIVDPATGKKKYFYGKTKAEINKKILDYHEQRSSFRTFAAVAKEWWREEVDNLALQTVKVYSPALDRAVARFGDRGIDSITPKDITSYLQDLAAKGFAAKTVANHRIVVNRVFTYAVISDGLTHNPCASAQMPKGLKKEKRNAASKTDEQKVIESADVWIFPFIALMTGMRKGEILALQWQDIDFDLNRISVTKSVGHQGDRPFIKEPKTEAGCRVVPLLPALRDELIKRKGKPTDYIVSDGGALPLTNRRFLTLMRHFKEVTGVSATAHQLRHSFATLAFESNIPAKTIQYTIGHKQLSTTMDIYTDVRDAALREASEALQMLGQKPL
jgi:integrase